MTTTLEQKRKAKDSRLRKLYGITLAQYEVLCANGCHVCGKIPKEGEVPLNVDHDHQSGLVRGVLCWFDNRKVVGQHRFPDRLRKAADYLESPPAVEILGEVHVPKRVRKKRTKKISTQANRKVVD